jgi:hypothetical protein
VVVLWGSSNDVARSNSVEGMKHTLDFVRNSNNTLVTLISVPDGHDLIRNSCVNNPVEAFNRRLQNKMQRFENVEMIHVITESDFYTQHGQHLYTRSKEKRLMKVACTIKSMLGGKNGA